MTPPQPTGNTMSDPYREDLGDLAKLPQDLRKQLAIEGQPTEKQQQIIDVIEARGGRASINEILIDLWRKDGEVRKRQAVMMMCANLKKNGHLFSTETGGVYATKLPDKAPGKAPAKAGKKAGAAKKPHVPYPDGGVFTGAGEVEPPPLDEDTVAKAKRAYNMFNGGKMDLGQIAESLGGGLTADQVRFLAMQYAKENGKPWP